MPPNIKYYLSFRWDKKLRTISTSILFLKGIDDECSRSSIYITNKEKNFLHLKVYLSRKKII